MHLEIPEPCHENWQDMTPKEKGRFCDKCCKVVVDFTNMATEKVIEFLSGKKEERVCGRFRPDQVVVPIVRNENQFKMHRAKIFLAALFFVFGGALFTGCGMQNDKMGKVANHIQGDTIPRIMGAIPVPRHDTTKKSQPQTTKGEVKCVAPDTSKPQIHMPMGGPKLVEPPLMGAPMVYPQDTL